MQIEPEIALRNVPAPEREAALVAARRHAERLERFHKRITSCRVLIERPNPRQRTGSLYHVRVEVTLPGKPDVVVRRDPAARAEHEELGLALRDAFRAARRQLQDRLRTVQGAVKVHEPMPHARVVRTDPRTGYGFLCTSDGREIYFHRHAVRDGEFDELEPGTEVRYVEESGDEGPQASTVHVVGRHGGR